VSNSWIGSPITFGSIGVGLASDGASGPGTTASIVSVTVPEPAGVALLGVGLLAMRAGRKRRGRQARRV